MEKSKPGTMAWFDLTVPAVENIRDFYAEVVGWQPNPVSMGEYDDYSMQLAETGEDVAGICHKRGENADLPPYWMLYFVVDNLQESLARMKKLGGEQVSVVKSYGDSRYVIIKDPAGAYCALYQE